MDYQEKVITVQQALSFVKSNDVIVTGMVGAEAHEFLSHLHELDSKIKNVSVTNCLPMFDADFFSKPEFAQRFHVDSWFLSGGLRKAWGFGATSFIPNHLHLSAVARLDHVKPNIYVGCATPPDEHGFVSLSVCNVYEKRMIEQAGVVILELNPNYPRTFGDVELHISEVDYVIPVNYAVPEIPDQELNEKDIKIGQIIAGYIKDGDCLQLGIGGIPNAVANSLLDKRDLGVHTEMLTSGFMKLWKAGAISNKYKNINKGKMVACFVGGTKALYEFVDNNPGVLILDGNYVNDPYVIGQNDNQVSINSTIEVDVTGQCCSESIGSRQFRTALASDIHLNG
jgi:acyl-CoA hydrolase